MPNVKCISETVRKYDLRRVIMQKGISQIIVHVLLLFLLVEEMKLKNHSTINHDIAHAGTWHWWLVHRHKMFSLTPLLNCMIREWG